MLFAVQPAAATRGHPEPTCRNVALGEAVAVWSKSRPPVLGLSMRRSEVHWMYEEFDDLVDGVLAGGDGRDSRRVSSYV